MRLYSKSSEKEVTKHNLFYDETRIELTNIYKLAVAKLIHKF